MVLPPPGMHRDPPSHLPSYARLASQKITERFLRNPEKPADEDVAERVFMILDERIQLRYHCREDHITASKREFLRRTEVDSKGNKIIMTPDMCISFEVGPEATAGRGSRGWSEESALGTSVLSQRLGRTGMASPGSQPGNSPVPLGKIKSSRLRLLLFALLGKLSPFPLRQTAQQAKTAHCPHPQPWAEQIPGPRLE